MGKISDKELQEFWLRCGFRYERRERRNSHWHCWVSPDGKEEMTYPPLDLNNLFKYALPTKEIPSFHLSYEYYLSGYIYRAKVCHRSGIWREGQHQTDPAQALYHAIQKTRHSAGKG